ncbi:hypothetical protein A0U94_00290 [Gluconobacter albidus]|uniref:MFS transporter n=1 Tax=Gluconobacter albidus TaxID=318683 RepID=UPI0009BC79CF|nr:MFS transporter [Gluconobacter albidus]AQS89651.1 hypothetical protein A0U94_00290 [Gluconobacter albidus]
MLFDELSVQKFHFRVLIAGACGIFTDGYVLGSISPALPSLTSELHLGPHQTGLVASAPLAGLLVGSLLASPVLDRIGRRIPFAFDMMAFVVLALLHALVSDLASLLVLRFIIGCLLGLDYVAGKLYVSEFLPSASRGRLMSWLSVAWVGGYTSAYAIGYVLHLAWPQGTWKMIFISAAVPALCAAVLRYGMPESILWLVSQRRSGEARKIADRHFGAVDLPARGSGDSVSGRTGVMRRMVLLFSGVQGRHSLGATVFYVLHNVPYLVLSAFLPDVLRRAGLHDPFRSGLFYDALLVSGSVIGLWIVDRFRRRSLMMGSFILQGSCLFLISLFDPPPFITLTLLTAFGFILTAADCLTYVYPPEVFPTDLRATGVSLMVSSSRLVATVSTALFPAAIAAYGLSATLEAIAVLLFAGAVICGIWAPETQGKNLSA